MKEFNTLSGYQTEEEKRKSFNYGDFTDAVLSFGEELRMATSYHSMEEIRLSLPRAASSLANASLRLIESLEAGHGLDDTKAAWGSVLATTVGIMKEVLALAAGS